MMLIRLVAVKRLMMNLSLSPMAKTKAKVMERVEERMEKVDLLVGC
jgi:hypothetical protein